MITDGLSLSSIVDIFVQSPKPSEDVHWLADTGYPR